MAVKYDAELNSEIRRIVANYNKRAKRLLAKNKNLDIETVTVKKLKARYDTRRDLLYELSRLEMIRRDEKSVERAFKRDIRRAKIRLNYQIKAIKEQEGTPRFTVIKSRRLRNLEAKRQSLNKKWSNLDSFDLKTFKERVDDINRPDPLRLQKFYDNFFDMLFKNAYHGEASNEQLVHIEQQLRLLSPDQLLEAYNQNSLLHSLVDFYHSNTMFLDFEETDEDLGFHIDALDEAVEGIVTEFKNF